MEPVRDTTDTFACSRAAGCSGRESPRKTRRRPVGQLSRSQTNSCHPGLIHVFPEYSFCILRAQFIVRNR